MNKNLFILFNVNFVRLFDFFLFIYPHLKNCVFAFCCTCERILKNLELGLRGNTFFIFLSEVRS